MKKNNKYKKPRIIARKTNVSFFTEEIDLLEINKQFLASTSAKVDNTGNNCY